MAYTDFHVFGPAQINVSLAGGNPAPFAFSDEGVDIRIQPYFEDVMSDDTGPMMPADRQYMGASANINMNVIRWDEAILRYIQAFVAGNTPRIGGTVAPVDIGTLMIAGGRTFGMTIQPVAQRQILALENGYGFPYCFPSDVQEVRVGTRVSRYRIAWQALQYAGTLYTRI